MHAARQRRLEASLEASLEDHGYSCENFCGDLPYCVWNTCPVCICGLMPVLVVCFSAMFRLDYAHGVNDISAHIANDLGLSYTVYYTAGCWPAERSRLAGPAGNHYGLLPETSQPAGRRCNSEHFEIAAGEFDAIKGELLRVRNVTRLRAVKLEAVKVTPDWRYIVFIGALANDIGNLYVVGARETNAEQAVPVLREAHLDELDERCQLHSKEALQAAGVTTGPQPGVRPGQFARGPPEARLAGLRHLHVIIPDDASGAGDQGGLTPEPAEGVSPVYRAAFAFDCLEPNPELGKPPLQFSKLAVVDFQIVGRIGVSAQRGLHAERSDAYAAADLRVVDVAPARPPGADGAVADAVARLKSQSCPRFVPSKLGHELLFVAEDVAPRHGQHQEERPSWSLRTPMPSRVLGLTQVHPVRQSERRLAQQDRSASGGAAPTKRGAVMETETETRTTTATVTTTTLALSANLLTMGGEGGLPTATVRGCPEFMPSLYLTTQSLAVAVTDGDSKGAEQRAEQRAEAEAKLAEENRDTFVFMSEPTSSSVVGVDGQVLAASLQHSLDSQTVSRVHLLYDVDKAPATAFVRQSPGDLRLRLGGCQPIRAAGRQGHMKLQWLLEKLMNTFRLHSDTSGYTTWLACLTADQRVAIVESPDTEQWINMSMPYPLWTGSVTQDMWCPDDKQEACFEVWSNPNPNE